MGVSPVDLKLQADGRPGVLQPLDGKPQTERQLGQMKEERER